jgi:hypothetical protein
LGDAQAKQLRGNARQAFKTDMMAVVQIGEQGANARVKRASWLYSGRGLGTITMSASPAALGLARYVASAGEDGSLILTAGVAVVYPVHISSRDDQSRFWQ